MVLNKLSLSEHIRKESMRNVMATKSILTGDDGDDESRDDDHTETTFSIDDSFLGVHDDSLKSNHSDTKGLPTLPEGNAFEKVPMRWLPSMQSKSSFGIEDEEEEVDLRDLMKESRAMSDCSFKPHESLDSLGWQDMRDYMRKTGSFKPKRRQHDSMRNEDGWGSMRDLDIQEVTNKRFSCSDQRHNNKSDDFPSTVLLHYISDSLYDTTFARNMGYLQQQAKDLTSSVGAVTFVRNVETLSMMFTGRTQ